METYKTAIITGASKGIGRAIALGLSKLGYQTCLIGRNQNELNSLANQIKESGAKSPAVFQLDITNSIKIKSAVNTIVEEYSRIDVLVNNAGIYFDGSTNITEENLRKLLETNVTAQIGILKEIVPIMTKQKSGYIFNIASRSGKVGFAGSGAYSASKFALVGFNEALYRELNPLGIRVTALCPGWVNTKMAVEAGTSLNAEQMIQPEDIFNTIKWLLDLSPGACVKEVVLETPYNIS